MITLKHNPTVSDFQEYFEDVIDSEDSNQLESAISRISEYIDEFKDYVQQLENMKDQQLQT